MGLTWLSESCSVVSNSLQHHGLHSPGQHSGVGILSLLQRIFPIQRLNPGIPYCRQILYQLSYKGNPKILEWVAYLFSIELLNPGFKPGSPALQGNSLPTELLGKPYGEPLTKEWYDFFCNFNWLIKLLYAVQTGMEQEWDRDNCEEAMRPG